MYKAGDKVVYLLTEDNISANGKHLFGLNEKQIVKHEPAPEPIVEYIAVFDGYYTVPHKKIDVIKSYREYDAILKLTYNPNDKTASVEVVET